MVVIEIDSWWSQEMQFLQYLQMILSSVPAYYCVEEMDDGGEYYEPYPNNKLFAEIVARLQRRMRVHIKSGNETWRGYFFKFYTPEEYEWYVQSEN